MDPDFVSRYLPDDDKEQPAARGVSEEPGVGAEPQAPAEAAAPEPPTVNTVSPLSPLRPLRPPVWPRAGFEPTETTSFIDRSEFEHLLPPAAPSWPSSSVPPSVDPRGFDPRFAPGPAVPAPSGGFDPRAAEVTTPDQQHAAPPQHAAPALPEQQGSGLNPAATGRYAKESASYYVAPPTPAQQGWDGSSGRWDAAAAEAPSRLRADDASLVRSRKVPAAMGWRHGLWVGSAHAINLGAGAYEQALLDDRALIASNIPGNYQIAFLSVRGGVGKTATTAGVGTAFAKYRTDQVIAIDANPTYGGLGRLIDPKATTSIVEFTNDHHITGYPMARRHTGKNAQGLEVLASNQNVANQFQLTPGVFGAALARTRRFYQLALVDCGPEIEHEVMSAVIGAADALVIVGTMNYDGAAAAETTLNWLAARNKHDLLRRSVLVLNDIYNNAAKPFVEKVHQTLGKRVGSVATIPWDQHVRDAAVLDWDALRTPTERAYISVAATLAKGFPTAGTVQTMGGGPAGTARR
jgi:MinD-like ATPase involved in chromosome partitioning or flagellar assembly